MRLDRGTLQRMDGLTNQSSLRQIQDGINELVYDMLQEGFEAGDISEYLGGVLEDITVKAILQRKR